MRAGLPKREPDMLQGWYAMQLYQQIQKKNQGRPLFVLHDGPPYANGNIHIGTALNKILKDIIIRHRSMTGFQAPYVPGWDTHGLPIESAILKDKSIRREELTDAEFRDKCRDFALSFVDKQREQFKRLGVLGDWDNPYLTLKPEFEAQQVRIFGAMAEKGYIYKGMKPVYWCPHDETALAEAEIEYADDPCTTIFVKFPLRDDRGRLSRYGDPAKISFVIWTTTPWTLPGNRAICVNPQFDYVLLQVPGGEIYVLAEGLVESVCRAAGLNRSACRVLATLKGRDFELMTAKHPLFDRDSIVLCGEHVTLEAGTGCVHTAPGFGADDFFICRQYDEAGLTQIGTPVPVNARGIMTDERYNGQYYAKANEAIPGDLEAVGALLASERITHSYPHCWRCKQPIIYRATEQWFCSVDAIKDAAVAACDQILWHPAWGKERMTSMITERNDWCISRQRKWGVPIPIFYCDACGADLVTPETIDRIATLFARHGSNIWFDKSADELVPEGFVCPRCGHRHFSKETDIMDVWFDSGSTHAGVLSLRPELHFPADVYLEGGDQYRGWFQSSLLTAIAARGQAPYKQIITHGWTVDGEGRAMHKSLGNAVAPEEVIKDYGADMLRLWVASSDYTQDMRISPDILKQLSDKYLKIRNTARYILGNLADFDPAELLPWQDLEPLDRWALIRLNQLLQRCLAAYERYEFHAVTHAVHNFCVVDMSNFYLDIIKDKLYCEAVDSPARRAAQTAIYLILDALVRLLAPILAFTANEIWLEMPHRAGDDARHVMLNDMVQPNPQWVYAPGEEEHWDRVLALRSEVLKALEQARAEKIVGKPLDAEITLSLSDEAADRMHFLSAHHLEALFIVSRVTVVRGPGPGLESAEFPGLHIQVQASQAPKCARCWTHSDSVGTDSAHPDLCSRCAAVLGGR